MGIDSLDTHRTACLKETGRLEQEDALDSGEMAASEILGTSTAPETRFGACCGERRVISRASASLIVAIPGLVLLGLGLLLLHTAPPPAQIIGQDRFVQRFCGLVATTTGSAALAASAILVASSVVNAHEKQSRYAVYALGLALIAAIAALA